MMEEDEVTINARGFLMQDYPCFAGQSLCIYSHSDLSSPYLTSFDRCDALLHWMIVYWMIVHWVIVYWMIMYWMIV